MKYWFLYLSILFVFGFQAQNSQFQTFSVEEGLPQSQVYAMTMDHNNRIWLGTKGGGVSVFNGEKFRVFGAEEGLKDDKIFALMQDSKRIIWVGTGKGVYRFDGLRFEKVEISDESIVVSSILESKDGVIWVATNRGLFYLIDENWHSFSKEYNVLWLDVSFLFQDSEGNIWTGSDDGLFQVLPNGYQQITSKDGLSSNKVRSINEVNGKLIVGTYGGGLNALLPNGWYVIGSTNEIINDVFVDSKNQIWLATHNNGVSLIKPSTNEQVYYTTKDGLSTNHTRIIKQDAWGNIWIGTSGGGLNKMFTPNFTHFNKKDGFLGEMFYAIEPSFDGGVWVSTSGKGIAKVRNDSVYTYSQTNGFKDLKSKALFEDSQRRLWIGTEGEGVYVKQFGNMLNIDGESGLADNWIRDFEEDELGNIWVATVSGMSEIKMLKDSTLDLFTIKDYSTSKGLPDDRINCLAKDDVGRIWFGCQSGHIGYVLDQNIYFTETDHDKVKSPVKSIDVDEQNRIWFATEGNGVWYINPKDQFLTLQHLDKADGLNSNNVYLIQSDQKGKIWAGAGSGVDEISLSETDELLSIKHYAKNEGFLGGETCSNSAALDKFGRVWIGTLDGLNCFSAKSGYVNNIPPKVFLEDITIFYESILNTELKEQISSWFTVDSVIDLHYTQNHLSFHFDAINLINPDKIYFQYQLSGFDSNWSPISDRRDATYSNLPSGEYVFRVKAVNEDGIWSDELTVPIKVSIPYWKTTWFYVSVISGGAIIVLLIILVIFLRYRRKNREEREKLQIERNLLELEQKTLRLQMNPHFIFNAMNTVQALIAKSDTKQARYYLAKFSKLMRKILENSRHAFISIQDEIETLENYLNLEKLSSDINFNYEIKVGDKIQPDAYGIPPLLLQPFVENAIVHGIKEIDYEGQITISFELKDKYVECVVLDNGRGRKAAKEVRQQKSSYHKSTALVLTQERLATLNNDEGYKSFEIIDLENPSGTKVVVRIPILEVY